MVYTETKQSHPTLKAPHNKEEKDHQDAKTYMYAHSHHTQTH